MDASQPRSDSFSHGWLRCSCTAPDAGVGHSFNSSASFIDMDPAELFSMRWSSAAVADDFDFDFGLEPWAGTRSPLLLGAGHVFSNGHLVLPCEGSACADVSAGSSPAFHSAQSTPASVIPSLRPAGARGGVKARAPEPLLATRRILLRYLRFLVPLCRKARALPLRVFAPRSRASLAAAPTATSSARRSTSSFASAAEYWCHGNADTAVRDAILYCKKSIGQDM